MVGLCDKLALEPICRYLNRDYVWVPGSFDVECHPVAFFPDSGEENVSFPLLDVLLQYYFDRRSQASYARYVLVVDHRKCSWASSRRFISHLNLYFPDKIEYVVMLRPQGFFQRFVSDKVAASIRDQVSFMVYMIDQLGELHSYIPKHHIPVQFGGDLKFNISSWTTFEVEINDFAQAASVLGQDIQTFVGDLSRFEVIGRIRQDLKTYEFNRDRADSLKHARHRLLRRLSTCETRGISLRKRLREVDDVVTYSKDEREDEAGRETICSLELPIDRATHIITVERYIIQLSETRSKLRKFWKRYLCGLRNLRILDEFEHRYTKLHPLLGIWESLIESVTDYLPGRSGAPFFLLPPTASVSDTSLRSASDESEETDSAVVMGGCCGGDDLPAAAALFCTAVTASVDNPMEGLLATFARAKEAQASGVAFLWEIDDLLALANNIKRECHLISRDTGQEAEEEEKTKRMSIASLSNLIARLTFDDRQPDTSQSEQEDLDESDSGGLEEGIESNYVEEVEEEEEKKTKDRAEKGENEEEGSSCQLQHSTLLVKEDVKYPPLVSLLPEYVEERVGVLHRLEMLARTTLNKAVSQLDRLVQLYTEINEARQWISNGNTLLSPLLTDAYVANLDPVACEALINELNVFCDSREQNLVLRGNPVQFRKQFADLLNAEMKVELSQMLRLVEEVEQALKKTIAILRQQISRNAFPRKPVSSQHQNSPILLPAKQASVDVESGHVVSEHIPEPATVSKCRNNQQLYQLALQELLTTEINYVKFLEAATQVFSDCPGDPSLPRLPAFLRDNRALLLVNLPEQLAYHKNYFYPQLQACNGDPLLIQRWAESSCASLVDLYTNYCLNYEKATQYAVALEKDRVHSQWMSVYNRRLNHLEGAKLEPTNSSQQTAANINRAVSCITLGVLPPANEEVTPESETGEENEENFPPSLKVVEYPQDPVHKSASLSRPVLSYSSRLLEPAQRFQRYHLLIGRLKTYAQEGPSKTALTEAHKCMLNMCDTVNALMRIRDLSGCPSRLGRLMLQGNFTVWCADSRSGKHQRTVFLFENTLLLTKLRQPNTSLVSTVLATLSSAGTSSQSLSSTVSTVGGDLGVEDATGNAKFDALPASLLSIAADSLPSKPSYEIKMELMLFELGLTPTIREDPRRFAVWTAGRAQTYMFQSNNSQVRSQWIGAINGLLSAQLQRLRDEVHHDHVHTNQLAPAYTSPLALDQHEMHYHHHKQQQQQPSNCAELEVTSNDFFTEEHGVDEDATVTDF